MKPSNKCKNCGDKIFETGNYTFKLIKSKRIPHKARRMLIKGIALETCEWNTESKFGKFLLKRSHPKNIIEVTCGNCAAISQMSMAKPRSKVIGEQKGTEAAEKESSSVSSTLTTLKKRKNKKPKEINAGLIIPSASDSIGIPAESPQQFSSISISTPKSYNSSGCAMKKMDSFRKGLLKSKKNAQNQKGASLKDFLSSM